MRQSDVYDYLKVHGPSTIIQIAMGMKGYGWNDADKREARKAMYKLKGWGMVRVIGTRKVDGGRTANVWEAVE